MLRSPGHLLLRFVSRLHGLLYQERAQTLAEYAMLTSFIVVGSIVVALTAFRTQVAVGYDVVADCLGGGCFADDPS